MGLKAFEFTVEIVRAVDEVSDEGLFLADAVLEVFECGFEVWELIGEFEIGFFLLGVLL